MKKNISQKIIFFIYLLFINYSVNSMEIQTPTPEAPAMQKSTANNTQTADPITLFDYIYAIKNHTDEEINRDGRIYLELIKELTLFNEEKKQIRTENILMGSFEQIQNIPFDSKIVWIGDIHGNLYALLSVLAQLERSKYLDEKYKINRPDLYFVFTGDYIDRGGYDSEVLTILLKLSRENPNRIFLCKGNHEDIQMNINFCKSGLIYLNINEKLELNSEILNLLIPFYLNLPNTLYLGITYPNINESRYVLFCHGMIPTKTNNPCQYSIPNLPDKETNIIYRDTSIYTSINEFLWNDFDLNSTDSVISLRRKDYFTIGTKDLNSFLQSFSPNKKVIAICRGHEHPKGYLTKDGPVFTSILSCVEHGEFTENYNFSIINIKQNKLINFAQSNICRPLDVLDYKMSIHNLN